MKNENHTHNCNCFCSIIPPHLIDKLAKGKKGMTRGQLLPEIDFRSLRSEATEVFQIHKGYNAQVFEEALVPVAKRKVYNLGHSTALNTNLQRSEGQAPVADAIVNASYDNAGKIRDFYLTQYGYNSFDNHGADYLLNVHYSTNYNNAFWDGHEMVFGDGDNRVFTNFANSLDVTAHELTHAVVQFTAGLIYNGQSGALNEHFADAFGVTIRQYYANQHNTPATANWLVGDTIMGPTLRGQAIRNMKAPGTAYNNSLMGKDPQPDNMKNYYKGTADNNGVHINSGIPNKVFYLSAVAIGSTLKAALVWFETLKTLTRNETFAGFKTKTIAVATALEAAHKIPVNSVTGINAAFKTVGL